MIPHRTATITPEMIAAASLLVRITHSDDASLARALGKAEARLMELAWTIDCGILQIASHSHSTDTRCTDGETCTCETTRGVCWHIGSWWLLSTIAAAGINPVAPLPLPLVLDEDDLPAESFLDGPFDAFEDASLTAWETPGATVPALPAFYEVDELPVARVAFRLQPSREHVNPLEADVDALFAA